MVAGEGGAVHCLKLLSFIRVLTGRYPVGGLEEGGLGAGEMRSTPLPSMRRSRICTRYRFKRMRLRVMRPFPFRVLTTSVGALSSRRLHC